jgi:hypothetical protein
MKITAELFRAATGHDPVNDDLERANCPKAGQLGHHHCGWDHDRNLPYTMVSRDWKMTDPYYFNPNAGRK